jgi:DNA-binding MarR family transcriptional regulator
MAALSPARVFRDLARIHVRAQRVAISCRDTRETHCTILTELGRGASVPMSDLVARLQLDKGWVSRAVDQLVQEGLVHRTADETDRRVVVISLTAAGRRRLRALDAILDGQFDRVFARIKPPGDRGRVAQALELLRAAYLEETADRPAGTSARSAAGPA